MTTRRASSKSAAKMRLAGAKTKNNIVTSTMNVLPAYPAGESKPWRKIHAPATIAKPQNAPKRVNIPRMSETPISTSRALSAKDSAFKFGISAELMKEPIASWPLAAHCESVGCKSALT